jgi:hypothetical protein
MDYVNICPPAIVYRIQEADLKSSSSSGLLTFVQGAADRRCVLAATEAVARRITPLTDPQVFGAFANTVASYASDFEPDQIPVIREAYLHYPYNRKIAGEYFAGLRRTGIDLRKELRNKVRPDWSFATPYSDGDTWDYYMYLASLNEPGALEALAAKIADTTDGNDVTLFLTSLADLPGPEVEAVLNRYAHDTRTADGVEGPAMSLADTVAHLMSMRSQN